MKTIKLQIFVLILLTLFLSSCKLSGLQARFIVPVDQLSEKPEFYLPFKIKWITPLFPEQKLDTYRPVENGAPVIFEDQVFSGTHFGQLICMDRKSGEVLWRFKAFGGIESVPAVYGENILFGDSDGKVYSVRRKDGFTNWIYKAQGEVMGRIVIHENKALFATTFNRIYAVSADDGSWIWTHQRALPEGFSIRGISTPVVDGDRAYCGLADGYVVAVDMERGREVWKNLLVQGDRFIDVDSTPVISGDLIYVAGYDGALYCLSKSDGEVKWKFGRGGISRVTLTEDRIYFANNDGFVFSLNRDTGKEIWKFDMRNRDQKKSLTKSQRRKLRVPTAPIFYGDFLVTGSSSGFLYFLDPENGTVLWRYLPGFGISSEVIKAEDGIYFLSNSAMLFKMVPSLYPPPII